MGKRPKIGLALGSGSARGLSHIGVIKVLEKNKVPIDYISGTSIGALIGGHYATFLDIKELEKMALKITKRDLVKLLDVSLPKNSLIKGKKIRNLIQEKMGNQTFSHTKIPLTIIATDLESGKEVIMNRGKLVDAMQASISIPGIFSPVELNGKLLIDGGVTNSTPVDVVKKMGADIIIGVDLTIERKVKLNKPNIFQTIFRSFEIIRAQTTKSHINKINKNIITIQPHISKGVSAIKFYEAEKFIKKGEQATLKKLSKIKRLINQFKR